MKLLIRNIIVRGVLLPVGLLFFLLSMAVIILSGIIYGKWTKEDFAGLQIVLHDTIDRYLSCYKL